MKMTRATLSVIVIVSSFLTACQAPASDVAQDEGAVRQVFDSYIKSVNAADVTLASNVWLQSPDIVVITPFGRFQARTGRCIRQVPATDFRGARLATEQCVDARDG